MAMAQVDESQHCVIGDVLAAFASQLAFDSDIPHKNDSEDCRRESAMDADEVETGSSKAEICLLMDLSNDLILHISLFLDVFTHQRCAFTAKSLNLLLKNNFFWSPRCLDRLGNQCNFETLRPMNNSKLLYLETPRLRCDGVYISKAVYERFVPAVSNLDIKGSPKEHFVTIVYYRYLLFIPETCHVLVLRSEAPPASAVSALKSVRESFLSEEHGMNVTQDNSSGWKKLVSKIVIGKFEFVSSTRTACISYVEPCLYNARYFNHAAFELQNGKRQRYNSVLSWKAFTVNNMRRVADEESTNLLRNMKQFRPYHFHRIRNYEYCF